MVLNIFICSVAIICCILFSKISNKIGVPALLLFLVLGMLFGSDGILKIQFDNYAFTEEICSITLIFIMFYGGFGTNWKTARPVAVKSFLLASFGVIITAVLTGIFCHYVLKIEAYESFLIGAVISSTDAASVFSILRSKNLNLKDGLSSMLELESGSNDPVAYMLTIIILNLMSNASTSSIPYMIFAQITFGILTGVFFAVTTIFVLKKCNLSGNGLDMVFMVAAALLSYSFASLIGGNGYLSVYIAGIITGNGFIRNKVSLVHFFDGVTGLMQIILFFLLGLLSTPSEIPKIIAPALLIALFLTFIGRPISIFAILTPFKVPFKNQILVSWAGLRGAASIVFAIMVAVSPTYTKNDIFHIVFCLCLISVSLQGTLLPILSKKLGLVDDRSSVLKTFNDYIDENEMELIQMSIPTGHSWIGKRLSQIELPAQSLAVMIKRDNETIIPRGDTVIQQSDIVILNCMKYKDDTDVNLSEILVSSGHSWANHTLKQIKLPQNVLVVMIKRNGEMILPNGDTTIFSGDTLIISKN